MKTAQLRTKILFENLNYVVCLINRRDAVLTVQSKRTGRGVLLACEHPQFDDYLAAFQEDEDAPDVMSALCRALLNI